MRTHRAFRNGRLMASSLLETVLAMALMGGALSTALWMHMRVLATDRAMLRLKAWSMTEELLAGGAPSSQDGAPGGITMETQHEVIGPGMERIRFTCTHGGRTLLVRHVIQPLP